MASERVLVTGGQGFIGKLLAARLARRGVEVFSERFDVGDRAAVERAFAFEPTVVVHLASPTDVAACERDPAMAERAIVQGTRNVVEAMAPGARLVFASSMMVYEEPTEGEHVLDEAWPTRPGSVYGRCKLEAEEVARRVDGAFVLRIFAHTHKSQPGSRFLSRMKERIEAVPVGEVIEIDASLFDQRRDIGGAVDLIDALDACIARGGGGTFNVCSGRARALGDLARAMATALGRKSDLTATGMNAALSIQGARDAIERALGLSPRLGTDEELVAYYLDDESDPHAAVGRPPPST